MTKILIALSSIFCLALFGGAVFGQGMNQFYTATVGPTYQLTGNAFEASWLIGQRVKTSTFGDLGGIDSLIIDRDNGRVALVVLSDVPGLGNKRLAVPYSCLDLGGGEAVFNPGDMRLDIAPDSSSIANWPYGDDTIYTLTRYPSGSEFYGVPSDIDAAWVGDIYRHYGQVPYWTEGQASYYSTENGGPNFVEIKKVLGAEVQLSSGEATGRIDDLVINGSDGTIPLLVLSGVPDRESSFVAVPFADLSIGTGNVFVLNTDREMLVLAPSFTTSDLNNTRYAGDVYRYFGVEPYWSEEGMAPSYQPDTMDQSMDQGSMDQEHSQDWYQMYGY